MPGPPPPYQPAGADTHLSESPEADSRAQKQVGVLVGGQKQEPRSRWVSWSVGRSRWVSWSGWVSWSDVCPRMLPIWPLAFVALAIAGAWGAFRLPRRGRELAAFLSSSAFLLGMVPTALAGNYPFWLRSTLDPSYSLTASNAASARYGMGVALT